MRTVEDLREASDLVSDVVRSLNNSVHECKSCGVNVRNNPDEFRAHVELTAIVGKLQKWITILEVASVRDR